MEQSKEFTIGPHGILMKVLSLRPQYLYFVYSITLIESKYCGLINDYEYIEYVFHFNNKGLAPCMDI